MKVCIITHDFPDQKRSVFTFVKQLVEEFAKQGNQCCVIAPYSITSNRKVCKFKEVISLGESSIVILRPNYLSVSNLTIGRNKLSAVFHERAVERALKFLPFVPDVFYAHFWTSAMEVYPYASKRNIPLFVATGESQIQIPRGYTPQFSEYISGVICVSSKNMLESIELGLTTPEKCIVLPNSINAGLFYKRDKQICRKKLGFSEDDFIIVFVGWFDDRKGANRVARAIRSLDNTYIKSIFIGKGIKEPDCDGILYKGMLSHDKIPAYLCAADVFVLPTLYEGCCNAIVEAMACGLPIISSDLQFNYDILDRTNSILVDPNNIDDISQAIFTLYNNSSLRDSMANQSILKSKQLHIDVRAAKIISFIKQKS